MAYDCLAWPTDPISWPRKLIERASCCCIFAVVCLVMGVSGLNVVVDRARVHYLH